ncbi:hypothetical protein [Pseudonocardia xishanensis]
MLGVAVVVPGVFTSRLIPETYRRDHKNLEARVDEQPRGVVTEG